ncbi:MAG: tetratricopeptide repeat protein [Burkholderiales bacterium]
MSAVPRPDDEDDVLPADLSVAAALAYATRRHQRGERELAIQLYARILEAAPEHPDALHFMGIALHQSGRSAQGLGFIERSIAALPDAPGPHFNRGNILLEQGRFEDATAAYARTAALGFDNAPLQSNLGVLYRAQGLLAEAERAYRRAIELDPKLADARDNLGNLYEAMGRPADAVREYCEALVLAPHNPQTRKMLGIAYQMLGRLDDAVAIYTAWLADEPANPLALHYIAACTGQGVPQRAPDDYVESVFDTFANSFDAKLAALTYRAPEYVAHAVGQHCAPAKALDVLDVGCGTGLCGPLLAPYARRLTGVDLSAPMLAKAEPRGVYTELVKAELTTYLQEHPSSSDLVVSADTLCYFGALDDAMAAAYAALRPGGWLVFTVEASVGERAQTPFHLHPHGRYSHASTYIASLLARSGFDPVTLDAVHLRMESGKPVDGWLVAAQRPAAAAHTH